MRKMENDKNKKEQVIYIFNNNKEDINMQIQKRNNAKSSNILGGFGHQIETKEKITSKDSVAGRMKCLI